MALSIKGVQPHIIFLIYVVSASVCIIIMGQLISWIRRTNVSKWCVRGLH